MNGHLRNSDASYPLRTVSEVDSGACGPLRSARRPQRISWSRSGTRRRAVVAVQVGVMLVVVLGFAALTIDIGTLYNARNDLQKSADAAALAGASALTTDDMMSVRQGTAGSTGVEYVQSLAGARVTDFAARNPSVGLTTTNIADGDIQVGWIDLLSGTTPVDTSAVPGTYNAVGVIARRGVGEDAVNEPVPFFFAGIFGKLYGSSSAMAVAAFDDRVSGVSFDTVSGHFLPFTIHEDAFLQDLEHGSDQYAWNESSGVSPSSSDGIREIRLYPYPLSGSGYEEGDGNFGTLNIGTGHQGVEAEREQILNGVTAADMEAEIGTSEPTFYDEGGDPVTYNVTGSPGLEATLKDAVGQIVGQVVGFFLHDNVILSGANATYTITGIRYGRVMDIRLTGPPHQRGLYIQPVSYAGSEVRIDEDAPSTGGLLGRIVLVR